MITIDINCDLGEGNTRESADKDALLMPYISSCNIACGGHAGNKETIEIAINNALEHGLKIGAHPGYSDRENFGRKRLSLNESEVVESLQKQLDLFLQVANSCKANLNHIKLHGALYNDVEEDRNLANVIAKYLDNNFSNIDVYGLAQGQFQKVCEDKNLNFIAEGFMDRRYLPNGRLTPRTEANAVINEVDVSIQQAVALAKNQSIESSTGELISPLVKTICLHGDNENALNIARQLYDALATNNVSVV